MLEFGPVQVNGEMYSEFRARLSHNGEVVLISRAYSKAIFYLGVRGQRKRFQCLEHIAHTLASE